ncbi:helix-turn-helix domain-containing protein [Microbacterium esteraromaticum]|uniref:helix-turn-helix domain-containing protein n=1 Tax=Microbacterium esteraromaticum TaxID=57043 RepID=UPI0019D3CC4C|nr:helix-turn-helix domain-containing protein [Microbacterium esteraromaticum]MBN7793785.1 helix-turn-helix domain-containing protein [Microbacterium esteraromaticum]
MSSDLAAILRAIGDGATPEPDRIRTALGTDSATADALVELAYRVEGLRQRSAELRVMMSSTRELLAEPDADLMLQRIVDHAHELIAGDVTYLSVYDPTRDELRVRAASGTISSRFLGMVVPAGVGLASRAVHTRHPQWVEDYTTLTSVPHDPTIDAIVHEERLRSMLGAPLVVKGEVLGVLFTAGRDARAHRPDEISLLSAFAGHAALVLHLARLLGRATDATEQAAVRQRQAEWAAGLHEELTRLAVTGHDAEGIAAALSDALGRRVTLRRAVEGGDPLGRVIRASGDGGRSTVLDDGPIELVAPILGATEVSGALLVERAGEPLTAVERRTVERSALTAALVLLRRDALADAEERVRGELAAELLADPARREAALARAAGRGHPIAAPWTALVVTCAAEQRASLLSRLRLRADWLVAPHGDGIAVLAPGDPEPAVTDAEATSGVDAALLVFGRARNLDEAADAVRDIGLTARLAHGLGICRGRMDAAVLAPYAPLFHGDGARLARFVDSMLHPVVDWDAAKGTMLFATLVALFDQRWQLAATARELHVHVNTLAQRIARLRQMLGPVLDAPEARFRLEMAVRVEQARRSLEQT